MINVISFFLLLFNETLKTQNVLSDNWILSYASFFNECLTDVCNEIWLQVCFGFF